MRVILHPAAEQDIADAAQFYEAQGSPTVAAKFVSEFKAVSALLAQHPATGSPRSDGRRGLCMNVFPYTVIYRATADEIKILVVKHDRKRPRFGASRA